MQIRFQERPWDLLVAITYTLAITGILLASAVGNPLAILLVIFVPGYVLVAALFPSNRELDWIERVALGFGLSIAVVPLIGVVLSFTPWGMRFATIVAAVGTLTAVIGFVALWRRMRLPIDQRLTATVILAVPDWKAVSNVDKVLTIALAASIVTAAGTLAYVTLTPRPGENFTEFYILGPGANASGYPTNLTMNETGAVIIGVVNHEAATTNYTIKIDLIGVVVSFNSTSGFSETSEVNRTLWSMLNITLTDSQSWMRPYSFQITSKGLWKVQFLLFKNGDFTSAYGQVHLPIRVI